VTPEPVALPPIEVTYNALPAAPVALAPEPAAEPEVAAVEPAPVEPAPAAEPVAEQAPAVTELPRTASPLPFLAVGGFTSLLAGLGIVLLRRRIV
jgi:LPXTG-motif cell wall-anchored protein